MKKTLTLTLCIFALSSFTPCNAQENTELQKPYKGLGKNDSALICGYEFNPEHYSLFACINSTKAANTDENQSLESMDANSELSIKTH